jgi:hypothetical protein
MADMIDLETLEELMKVNFLFFKFIISKTKSSNKEEEMTKTKKEAHLIIDQRNLVQEAERRNLINTNIIAKTDIRVKKERDQMIQMEAAKVKEEVIVVRDLSQRKRE